MCGRIALTPKLEKIIAQFGVAAVTLDELAPSYNVAPSRLVPVVTYAEKIQQRQIELMKWGLVPGWAKDPKIGNKMINARVLGSLIQIDPQCGLRNARSRHSISGA